LRSRLQKVAKANITDMWKAIRHKLCSNRRDMSLSSDC